jgi:excisionase family DNA binding protein
MDDSCLTTTEVLAYLQVNLRTVYRLLKAGRIPAVRVGRQWRFRRADLDAWLENQRPRTIGRAAAPPMASRQAEPHVSSPTQSKRVLVVDDEPSIRELLSRTLALAEYEVDAVPDGETAASRLRTERYDLLMTDLRMPGMDGLSLIRAARRFHPSLPIVIITGFSSEASAIEAVNLGVTGYLTKPFRVPKVLAVAAKALGEPTDL